MSATWALIANGSEARLFETDDHLKKLTLVQQFNHPESREKGSDLASDRPGHYQGETTEASHGAFNEPTDPKAYEMERFAIELAKILEEGRVHNRYGGLIIASSPHFHGLLNQHMNEHVGRLVVKHLEKDYTEVKEAELLEKLR